MKTAMIGGGWGAFAGAIGGFACQITSGAVEPHVTLWIGAFIAGILGGVLGAVMPAKMLSRPDDNR